MEEIKYTLDIQYYSEDDAVRPAARELYSGLITATKRVSVLLADHEVHGVQLTAWKE